jgi:hypothetical protein
MFESFGLFMHLLGEPVVLNIAIELIDAARGAAM